MVYISNHRGQWPVAILCRVPGVSESGYYKHLRFQNKLDKHANLLAQIYELLKEDAENANYGVRRIYDYLSTKEKLYREFKNDPSHLQRT